MFVQKLGKKLCLVLALLLVSCREDHPPKIEICIGDGFGGADCVGPAGDRYYKLPTQLRNYWMTNQSDQANFSAWCYDTSVRSMKIPMQEIVDKVKR